MTEMPQWALSPSRRRVEGIDLALRRRLADSLNYLGGVAGVAVHMADLSRTVERLTAAPVSPWVFCIYSKFVAELSRGRTEAAGEVFADLVRACSHPAAEAIIALGERLYPQSWWDHFQVLFDTESSRPFRVLTPAPPAFAACLEAVKGGLALLHRTAPEFHDEVSALLRLVVLAAPADRGYGFNGASTFFLWGATLINSDLRRSPVSTIDLLVHESSHLLLFGVAADRPLVLNAGDDRFFSPFREDERPIDGIFHACFVATRVHLAMKRMLASGALGDGEAGEAIERQQRNGASAQSALRTLRQHASLTELGEKVLTTLRDYWSTTATA